MSIKSESGTADLVPFMYTPPKGEPVELAPSWGVEPPQEDEGYGRPPRPYPLTKGYEPRFYLRYGVAFSCNGVSYRASFCLDWEPGEKAPDHWKGVYAQDSEHLPGRWIVRTNTGTLSRVRAEGEPWHQKEPTDAAYKYFREMQTATLLHVASEYNPRVAFAPAVQQLVGVAQRKAADMQNAARLWLAYADELLEVDGSAGLVCPPWREACRAYLDGVAS